MSAFGKRAAPPQTPPPEQIQARPVEIPAKPPGQSQTLVAEVQTPSEEQNGAGPAETTSVAHTGVKVKSGRELRASPRARVFKGAVISYDEHHFTVPCTVRNISETGARIQILEQLIVPDTFLLFIELDSIETDCEVVWRHGDAIGVKFLAPFRAIKKVRKQVVSESNAEHNSPLRRHPVR